MKSFKEWLKLHEIGTMTSSPTGGVGDIAQFKMPVMGVVRRTWPFLDEKKKKKKSS